MLSKNKRMINVQVSKDVYDYITTFSKLYNVSISSFCSDCISQYILVHNKNSIKENPDNPDMYFKKLANFIRFTYNEKRKNKRYK